MIKRKSAPKAGECAASRCTVSVPEGQELCVKHAAKNQAASASTSVDLAPVKAELEPVQTGAMQYLQWVASLAYDAPVQYGDQVITGLQALGHVGVVARDQLKVIEEKRTSITKPLLAAKTATDDLFRPAKDALNALIKCCNDRLAQYERERRAAQQQALAAVGQGAMDEHTLAVAHSHVEALPENMSARKDFVVEVVDFAQVPDQYKMLNERAVLEAAKATGGAVQIPGLRIAEDVRIVRQS